MQAVLSPPAAGDIEAHVPVESEWTSPSLSEGQTVPLAVTAVSDGEVLTADGPSALLRGLRADRVLFP